MPRRNYFDFPHTCPDINAAISSVEERIDLCLDDIVGELDYTRLEAGKLIKQYTDVIMKEVRQYFEEVRQQNADMREEAERQLKEAQDTIDSLQNEIDEVRRMAEY